MRARALVSPVLHGLAVSALLAAAALPAVAQDTDAVRRAFADCMAPRTAPAERIVRCDLVIESRLGDAQVRAGAHMARGFALGMTNDTAGAEADFNESIRLRPTATAYKYRAGLRLRSEDYARALPDLDQAIKLEPKDPDGYRTRAYVLSKRKDYARAIADLTSVIKLRDKPKADDYVLRAISHERAKQKQKAIADYRKALEIDPDDSSARRFLAGLGGKLPASAQLPPGLCSGPADTTSHQQRIKGCTAVIDSGKLKGWTLKTAYCNRGFALTEIGEYDRVIADSEALLKIDGNASCAYLNRGRAWYYKKEIDTAIANYNRAIEIEPKFHEALASRGTAYHDLMEFDRAIADYDASLRIEDDENVKQWRANTLRMKEAYGSAAADIGREIPRTTENADRYRGRGDLHAARGETDRAIADYSVAIELAPTVSTHLHARAKMYDLTGATELAAADRAEADKRQLGRFRALVDQAGKEPATP